MKKRFGSILLTLAMVMSLLPASAIPARAAIGDPCTLNVYIDSAGYDPSSNFGSLQSSKPGGPYYVGDTITLRAVPASGFSFFAWVNYETGESITTDTFTFVLQGDTEWDVVFKKNGDYLLNVDSSGGSVTLSPDKYFYAPGTQITLSAPKVNGKSAVFEYGLDVDHKNSSVKEWKRLGSDGRFVMPSGNVWVRALYPVDLTLSSIGHGTASLSPAGPYYPGDTVTLTWYPEEGYYAKYVFGVDSEPVGNTATFTLDNTPERKIQVAFDNYDVHQVSFFSTPGDAGKVEIRNADNDVVIATATPNYGYHFLCWWDMDTEEIISQDNPCTFYAIRSMNVSAIYYLNVGIDPNIEHGTLEVVDPKTLYTQGDTVTLLAHPDEGYHLEGYYAGEAHNGVAHPERLEGDSFVMPGWDMTVSARFTRGCIVNVKPSSAEGGAVFGAGTYAPGELISVTAVPAEGYTFIGWEEDGKMVWNDPLYILNVDKDHSFTAKFQSNSTLTFPVDASVSPAAGGTVTGTGVYGYGETVTLTATPASGYTFVNWSESGSFVSTDPTFSFSAYRKWALTANFVSATGEYREITTWSDLSQYMKYDARVTRVKLTRDLTFEDEKHAIYNELVVPVGTQFTLDLNGHKVDRNLSSVSSANSVGNVIEVFGELIITDSSEGKTGMITGGYSRSHGGGIIVHGGGKLTLEGGSITGNHADRDGGGVYLADPYVAEGVYAGAAFTMNGGSIEGNSAASNFYGGGVYVSAGATFTMNGGSIEGNSANIGGGVFVNTAYGDYTCGTFTMNSGSIEGNSANRGGGVFNYGSFTLNDGSIKGNRANSGGGVFGSLTMNGGCISQNSASSGGGIYATNSSSVITGGSIEGNSASSDGGGIFATSSVTILGGSIKNNTATGAGADLNYDPGADPRTVTYDGNGATGGTMEAQTLAGGVGTLNANAFTREGYAFIGWNTSADGSGHPASDGASVTLPGDVTLYAQWTNGYLVRFDANGAQGSMADQKLSFNTPENLSTCAFSLRGYEFAGWNTIQNPTEQTPCTPLADGASVSDLASAPGETVTLYAQWKRRTTTVTITPGEYMTKTEDSGAASQTMNELNAMTEVVYTADEGYYFSENYHNRQINGVRVARRGYTMLVISGTPTADTEITPDEPSMKSKPQTSVNAGKADCTTYSNNDGRLTGVNPWEEYKRSDAESWTPCTGDEVTGLTPGTYYVRYKETVTTLPTDYQELTIEACLPPTYAVTVKNGTGSDSYAEGESVTITADAPAAGMRFKAWTGANGLVFTSGSAATSAATFTMPARAVTLKATYEAVHSVTVKNGKGSGSYPEGEIVTITANAPEYGKRFKAWSGADGVTFISGGRNSLTATFAMPGNAVTVTATYEDVPATTYAVTVNNGAGGGSFIEGVSVTVTANAPAADKRFTGWAGADGLFFTDGGETSPTATFIMPGRAVALTAVYAAKEAMPGAVFTATGPDTGILSNVERGMRYSLDGGYNWTDVTSASVALTGLSACTISVVRKGSGTATADSDAQTITVTKAAAPTAPVAEDCTTAANNDGRLVGITAAMEYKKPGEASWTSGTGADITALAPGSYYVRARANGTALASDHLMLIVAEFGLTKYNVEINAGEHMTRAASSGAEMQSVIRQNSIITVVYTADAGYYFPTNYASLGTSSGLTVTRVDHRTITVSGTPTADVLFPQLEGTTAKVKPDAPVTPTALACTTSANNDGRLIGVTAAMEYRKSDAALWTPVTGKAVIALVPGTYYVRYREANTTLASEYSELTVGEYVPPYVRGDYTDEALYAFVCAPNGGLLVAAAYDANGKLVGVSVKKVAADAGEHYLDTGLRTVEGCTCKVMLVDSSHAPLCAAWDSAQEE